MTVPEIIRSLLEYIDWLETHGGYSLQDGGLERPLVHAQQLLKDFDDN